MKADIRDVYGLTDEQLKELIYKFNNGYKAQIARIDPVSDEIDKLADQPVDHPHTTDVKKVAGKAFLVISTLPSLSLLFGDMPNIPATAIFAGVGAAALANGHLRSKERHVKRLTKLIDRFDELDTPFREQIAQEDFFEMFNAKLIADVAELYDDANTFFLNLITPWHIQKTYRLAKVFVDKNREMLRLFEAKFAESYPSIAAEDAIVVIERYKNFWTSVNEQEYADPATSINEVARARIIRQNSQLSLLKDIAPEMIAMIYATLNFCNNLTSGVVEIPDLSFRVAQYDYVWG